VLESGGGGGETVEGVVRKPLRHYWRGDTLT
jgi:hypothetical protein